MSAAREQRLHELVGGAPSRERFRDVLALLAAWPEAEARAAAIAAADAALARWPADTRGETPASRLLDDPGGGVARGAALVRALGAQRLGQHGHRFTRLRASPVMSQLAILDVTDSTIDLAALAGSPHVQHLGRLRLVRQGISERAADAIART